MDIIIALAAFLAVYILITLAAGLAVYLCGSDIFTRMLEGDKDDSVSKNPCFSEFDKFIASLEEGQETAKQLSEARKWVVDSFYFRKK